MTGIAIICALLVLAAMLHLAHRNRSLAERSVDALYRAASIAIALAEAMDAALVRYRQARARHLRELQPEYWMESQWR